MQTRHPTPTDSSLDNDEYEKQIAAGMLHSDIQEWRTAEIFFKTAYLFAENNIPPSISPSGRLIRLCKAAFYLGETYSNLADAEGIITWYTIALNHHKEKNRFSVLDIETCLCISAGLQKGYTLNNEPQKAEALRKKTGAFLVSDKIKLSEDDFKKIKPYLITYASYFPVSQTNSSQETINTKITELSPTTTPTPTTTPMPVTTPNTVPTSALITRLLEGVPDRETLLNTKIEKKETPIAKQATIKNIKNREEIEKLQKSIPSLFATKLALVNNIRKQFTFRFTHYRQYPQVQAFFKKYPDAEKKLLGPTTILKNNETAFQALLTNKPKHKLKKLIAIKNALDSILIPESLLTELKRTSDSITATSLTSPSPTPTPQPTMKKTT